MKKARAAFVIDTVKREYYGRGDEAETITASALPSNRRGIPECEKLADGDTTGELTFYCTNRDLVGSFNPGDEFYVDIVPIK